MLAMLAGVQRSVHTIRAREGRSAEGEADDTAPGADQATLRDASDSLLAAVQAEELLEEVCMTAVLYVFDQSEMR